MPMGKIKRSYPISKKRKMPANLKNRLFEHVLKLSNKGASLTTKIKDRKGNKIKVSIKK